VAVIAAQPRQHTLENDTMDGRILVPLDGSPIAEYVLPWVRVLARGLDLPVELLACLSGAVDASAETGRLLHLAQLYLAEAAAPLEKAGLKVTVKVAEGEAAAEIAAEAERLPGTLLVMSTHGRSGLKRMALGSVADRVLRAVSCPVLVIRPEGEQAPADAKLEVLLVALDESELAERALPPARKLAAALGLKLLLVEALPSEVEYYLQVEAFAGAARDIAEAAEGKSLDYLQALAESLRKDGADPVEARVLHGTPYATLVEAAATIPGSLVVMTTHGRSGVGRWIMGSVADRVIRYSTRAVLIVPCPQAR
jgi:nucleotide-binding universal stress UspA family protein